MNLPTFYGHSVKSVNSSKEFALQPSVSVNDSRSLPCRIRGTLRARNPSMEHRCNRNMASQEWNTIRCGKRVANRRTKLALAFLPRSMTRECATSPVNLHSVCPMCVRLKRVTQIDFSVRTDASGDRLPWSDLEWKRRRPLPQGVAASSDGVAVARQPCQQIRIATTRPRRKPAIKPHFSS